MGRTFGVQVEPGTHAKDHTTAGKVTVLKAGSRKANGAKEDGIRLVLDAVPSALFPLESGFFPDLPATRNFVEHKPVWRVLHHRFQDAHGFWRDLTTDAISGEHGNAVVAHARATETSLLNGTPVENGAQDADSKRRSAPYFIVRHEDLS